jgi:hypothetical protein
MADSVNNSDPNCQFPASRRMFAAILLKADG